MVKFRNDKSDEIFDTYEDAVEDFAALLDAKDYEHMFIEDGYKISDIMQMFLVSKSKEDFYNEFEKLMLELEEDNICESIYQIEFDDDDD